MQHLDLDFTIECNENQLNTIHEIILGHWKVQAIDSNISIQVSEPKFYRNFGVLAFTIRSVVDSQRVYDAAVDVELTMTRREQYRGKDRKPIVSSTDIHEDLGRRDFTCNAIALNVREGTWLDPFDGRRHIEECLLQLIPGNEVKVFKDDPLRILRAFRFAGKYDWALSSQLKRQLKINAKELSWISKERKYSELIKIAGLPLFHLACAEMMRLEVLPILFPDIDRLTKPSGNGVGSGRRAHKNMWLHTLKVIEGIEGLTTDPLRRLIALLHDIGKPDTAKYNGKTWTFYRHEQVGAQYVRDIFPNLGFNKVDTERVAHAINMHQQPIQFTGTITEAGLRRFINRAGKDIEDILILASCDFTTKYPAKAAECRKRIEILREKIAHMQSKGDYINFKLDITGKEIARIFHIQPSPEIGRVKQFLTNLVLDGIIDNERKILRAIILQLKEYKSHGTRKTRQSTPRRAPNKRKNR